MIVYQFKKYWQVMYSFDLGQYFINFCDLSDKKEKVFWGIHDGIPF